MSAVSARPLRAPWEEMKYSSTESPSRKDAVIGRSMMSPDGLAMRPRMPASWRIWSLEPRALESTIMNTGFSSVGFGLSADTLRSIVLYRSSPTFSVAADQMSTTLLWRSPSVITPCWNCDCTFSASWRAFAITSSLSAGRIMSLRPIDAPEIVT